MFQLEHMARTCEILRGLFCSMGWVRLLPPFFGAIFVMWGAWHHEACAEQVVSLDELEAKIHTSPQVLVAAAELEQQINLFEREQALSGWKVFGGISNGYFQEATDVNVTRQFGQSSIRMGLRYPLLGTRAREQLNILHAEARTWENRQKLELSRQISLNALRSHYVNAWGSERQIQLSKAFLEGRETVERLLEARTAQGFLLDADRQEFITAFELASRSIARAQALQKRSLGVIHLMTGSDLSGFGFAAPSMAAPCLDEARLKAAVLDGNPELVLLRGRVDEELGALRLGHRSDIDASLDLAGSGSIDYPEGQPGYGVSLSLNIQMPAGVQKAGEAGRRASQAGLKKTQLEVDRKAGELLTDAADAVEQYRAAEANLRFARQRVRAALEAVREGQLRAGFLPGDTLERLQRSRFQYYQTCMDLIDAEVMVFQAQAAVLKLAPEGCAHAAGDPVPDDPTHSVVTNDPIQMNWLSWPKNIRHLAPTPAKAADVKPAPAAGVARPIGRTTVYLWESAPWLDGSVSLEAGVKALSDFGIGRVFISLDKAQIKAAALPDGGKRLRGLLEYARESGLSVELLLGEPTWILPGFREDLLLIIQRLKHLPFDGLHLDLEPDQLDQKIYSREYLVAELIHTLQAAKEVSPWPVGFSVHPRYFDTRQFKACLGCALQSMGISEVVLMIYVADAKKVVSRASGIMKSHPALRFSVAMSVESELSSTESFESQGLAGLQRAMDRVGQQLKQSNFAGIVIQSWEYLKAMKP